jgi:hypothetical protein
MFVARFVYSIFDLRFDQIVAHSIIRPVIEQKIGSSHPVPPPRCKFIHHRHAGQLQNRFINAAFISFEGMCVHVPIDLQDKPASYRPTRNGIEIPPPWYADAIGATADGRTRGETAVSVDPLSLDVLVT